MENANRPSEIGSLVEYFRDNQLDYESGGYKEARARNDLVDPLFETLGWDVRNKDRHAEAYREVILEDSIQIEGRAKAPDYCFRVGQTPKFYVEAKKPSVSIKDNSDAAYQLRRYGWSARLPLSILTNFRELSVYDCRIKPKATDPPSAARILYITQDEYASRWGELEGVFSKDAILRGSFDRFAESTATKRGSQAVDDAFLDQLEIWRNELARVLALRNAQLSSREMNYAVQTILDRIIFLRICEESEIEPYGRLKTLLRVSDVYRRLVEFFRLADDRYNSGLFHFELESKRNGTPDLLTPGLHVDDKVLKDIIQGLYYPTSPYEFSVISPEILGEVYEQFLGRVIRLTPGHQAKVEEKPEVKEAGGVFYTPKYVVDRIVAETIGPKLKERSITDIAGLRILDPACGSGSFLLGAYRFLLEFYRGCYLKAGVRQNKDKLVPGRGGTWFLSGQEKKRILLTHIFGVDIDQQAVEVTKLSLLLEVLRDETKENIDRVQKLFHERALPDLDDNIKCGNSLLESRALASRLIAEDERLRVNPFEFTAEFGRVFSREDPGFDVVLGNPPYVRVQALNRWAPVEVELLKSRFVSAQKGNYDLYVVFVERALELLRSVGTAGFILPHKFMHLEYGEPLRDLLSKGRNVTKIIHFGTEQVFPHATTYTCLLFLSRGQQKRIELDTVKDLAAWEARGVAESIIVPSDQFGPGVWAIVTGAEAVLMAKLRQSVDTLESYAERIFQGLATSKDSIFILDLIEQGLRTTKAHSKALREDVELENELLRPLLKGSEIGRYTEPEHDAVVIFPYRVENGKAVPIQLGELETSFPLTQNYLSRNKTALLARSKTNQSNWWLYPYPKNLTLYVRPKLLSQVLSRRGSFGLDTKGDFCFVGGGTAGGNAIMLENDDRDALCALLAVLNSPVTSFFVANTGSAFRGGFHAFGKASLKGLPIPRSFIHREAGFDRLAKLTEEMLHIRTQLAASKLPHEAEAFNRQARDLDRRITEEVFALYKLSPEERVTITDSLRRAADSESATPD